MKPARDLSSRFRNHLKDHPAQGLVEFALALPILLLLIFGVIEFGRLLQAWLALENGARFGVRYAITGSYDPQYCDEAGQALGLSTEDYQSDYNTDCIVTPPSGSNETQRKAAEEKTNSLQDWARLASIRDATMAGATGIAWNQTVSGNYLGYLDHAYQTSALESTYRGSPNEDGYFGISICSNRFKNPSGDAPYGSAFMFNPNPFYLEPYPPDSKEEYRFPIYCQQAKLDSSSQVTGDMVRYVDDAGGPGDRVRVVLTYRHHLITPFLSSWWPTLRLSSEREGLVEKFRVSRVTGLAGAIAFAPTWTFTAPPPTQTLTPTNTPTPATCAGTGTILREWWEGVGGSSLSDLTNHADYPDYPSGYNYPTSFDGPKNWTDNYGTRFRGYICPPYTGAYTFYIASDDQSNLYISSSTNPDDAVRIAYVKGWTSYQEWNKYPEQKSSTITLVGGQFYYIEAVQKEGGGGDSISVGWTGYQVSPDDNTPTIIEGQYLKPYPRVDLPTRTPTPLPPAACDQLENLSLTSGSNESLSFQYISYGGYLLESKLKNNSPYDIHFTGADMNYNGDFHNEIQGPDPDRSFALYAWDGNTSAIYDPPNTSDLSYGHTFPNPKVMTAGQTGWFKFTYDWTKFKFWVTPSLPYPSGAGDPWGGSSPQSYNFFWPSDFNGHLYYNVVPPAQTPTVSCVMDLTGKTGPLIKPTFTTTSSTFSLRAVVEGNQGSSGDDINVREVRFFVYNSAGQLVHWSKDTSKKYCLFGGGCNSRQINVDYWSYGSSQSPYRISNDTYTFIILAENNDSDNRYKSSMIVETLSIQANTPTPSRTPTRTLTSTPVTPSTTPTKSLTPTPKTPTLTPTKSNTPKPATATLTSEPSATPTKCQTPIELGGCR